MKRTPIYQANAWNSQIPILHNQKKILMKFFWEKMNLEIDKHLRIEQNSNICLLYFSYSIKSVEYLEEMSPGEW